MNTMQIEKHPISLDKQRSLAYDLNAFCTIQSKYGSLTEALDEMQKGSFIAIRAFLWAGLLHEDESLVEKDVGKWISPRNLEEAGECIVEAIQSSLPEEKKNQPSP